MAGNNASEAGSRLALIPAVKGKTRDAKPPVSQWRNIRFVFRGLGFVDAGNETSQLELARHHDPRANPRALIKVNHVLVCHADAARRNRLPDRIRFIGPMDSIECACQIHGPGPQRIVRSPRHMTRKVGPTSQHLGRRRPIRPLSLVSDMRSTGPGKSWPSDADAVLKRLMVRHDEVESTLAGADDDRARNSLPSNRTVSRGNRSCDRLQLRIQRVGEHWCGSGAQKETGHQGRANQIAAHQFPRKANRPP